MRLHIVFNGFNVHAKKWQHGYKGKLQIGIKRKYRIRNSGDRSYDNQ